MEGIEKYKVYFYFGLWKPNPFVKPSKVVEVEMFEWETENDIVEEGLKQTGLWRDSKS